MSTKTAHERFKACAVSVSTKIRAEHSAENLARYRLDRLADIVRLATEQTARGAARLRPILKPGGLNLDGWRDIAPLQKHQIMADRGGYLVRQLPPESGESVEGWTAGTTGQPLNFRTCEMSTIVDQLHNQHFFQSWSLPPDATLIQIGIDRAGMSSPMEGQGWHLGSQQGRWIRLPVSSEARALLQLFSRHAPAVLKIYPLTLAVLIESAQRDNVRLPMHLVLSGGNIVDSDLRDGCRDIFGCEIADTYGAEELGCIALQCRNCGQMHVCEESQLVEVVTDNGEEAKPGETGRVIVTSFFSFAMPFIRYDLEDYVEVGDSSLPCARGRLTFSKIRGRSTTAFHLADGRVHWPYVPAHEIFALGNVRHFQFVQTAFDEVSFNYVPLQLADRIPKAAVQSVVDRYMDASLRVTVQQVAEIPREADMKYMLFRGLA